MYFSAISLAAALVLGASAIPFAANVVHERRDYVPKAWVKQGRVDSAVKIPVRIGMTQKNLNKGHDLLMEVSSPESPKYGKHYSAQEVADIFAPSRSSVDSIHNWLVKAGVPEKEIVQSINKQWIQFDSSMVDLEALLDTEYYLFEHIDTGKTTIACEKYHIPAIIREHVDYITPGVKIFSDNRRSNNALDRQKRTFGITNAKGNSGLLKPLLTNLAMSLEMLLRIPALFVCGMVITPTCIKHHYQIPDVNRSMAGNEMGIFEALGDIVSQQDLNLFYFSFARYIPQGTGPEVKAIDGAVAPTDLFNSGVESGLDFQLAYPLLYPQKITLFQTDDPVYQSNYSYQGFFNTFLDALDGSYCSTIDPEDPVYPDPSNVDLAYKGELQCGVYKPTNVISISYGGAESDLPAAYQQRQCAEFMKLGLQGVSIILASGDSGVGGAPGENENGCLGSGDVFNPDFPSTCPYVTVVGSTTLKSGLGFFQEDQETSTTRFGSGGGFSNIYPIPSYQNSAVTGYLQKNTPPYKSYMGTNNSNIGADGGVFNSAGRGYPDVSALGDQIVVINKGIPMIAGGTSASAPIFASILNRINEERLAAEMSTVGFVNPVLYANPTMFNDVTSGNNPGCNTNGFSAANGWDPVSGLGTPNYPAMLKVFMDTY